MNKYFFVLITLLVFSCAPKKIITATKAETSTTVKSDIKDSSNSQTGTKSTVTDQSDTDTETVIETTTYDSDKPNVSGTDKPPVKEVKKVTEKKVNKGHVKIISEVIEKLEAKHEDNSKAIDQVKTDAEVKEIPKVPEIKYWLYLFGFIAVTILALKYWVVIKKFLGLK